MTQLRSVICRVGSHSVTCYPSQVNTPRLNPSHTSWNSIYLPQGDGRLSWPSWLDSALARSRTSDLLTTSQTLNRCTTKTMCNGEVRNFIMVKNCPLSCYISNDNVTPTECFSINWKVFYTQKYHKVWELFIVTYRHCRYDPSEINLCRCIQITTTRNIYCLWLTQPRNTLLLLLLHFSHFYIIIYV